jgi:phosphatidylglycerophosphatase C
VTAPRTGATIAAFDVDGTLTVRDCVVPFMRRVRGTTAMATGLGSRSALLVPAVLRRDRDRIKQLASGVAFRGVPVDHLDRCAAEFGPLVARDWLRTDTLARLNWHREQGHRVVLVSASFEAYLGHLGQALGADVVLGTRLEIADGRYTGRLEGVNCRGPEKVRRLHDWLEQHHGGRGSVEVWAYGDSAGDRELLADADHPIWVRSPLTSVFPRV